MAAAGAEPLAALAALDAPISAVLDMIPGSVYNPSADGGTVEKRGQAAGKALRKATDKATGKATGKVQGKAQGKAAGEQNGTGVVERKGKQAKKGAVAVGELKEKLAGKVAALRDARRADEPAVKEKAARRKRKRDEVDAMGDAERKKLKGGGRDGKGGKKDGAEDGMKRKGKKDKTGELAGRREGGAGGARGSDDKRAVSEDGGGGGGEEDADYIEVAGVEAVERRGRATKPERRGRKASKLQVLERELAAARQEAEGAAGAEGGGAEGGGADAAVLAREMDKALVRAGGGAVRDRTDKIRKTIRKEKRKKEKAREGWEARKGAVEEEKERRQAVREERLKERRDGKGKGGAAGKGKGGAAGKTGGKKGGRAGKAGKR